MVGNLEDRYIRRAIASLAFEGGKIAFVSGPRQCGKTTVGRLFMAERSASRYATWDDIDFRRIWIKSPKSIIRFEDVSEGGGRPLVVLDEIHKARGWKRTLKGVYDTLDAPCDILVTGSARLDVYKRGGESLLGRNVSFRLHPFSLGEIGGGTLPTPEAVLERTFAGPAPAPVRRKSQEILLQLLEYGGFPEPFLRQSARFARIWRRGRTEKIVREDLRDLSRIPELSRVEMLTALLPERAGHALGIQSLREDLEVSFDTVKRWIDYLKELFYVFEIKPYAKSIPRSLKKEGKLFMWDWSEVEAEGSRFENLVACHLLKAVDFWTDTGEGTFGLQYLKDKEKREVDFLITRDRKPWLAIECKIKDTAPNPAFRSFVPRIGCDRFLQLVRDPGIRLPVEAGASRGLIVSAADFLAQLP